MVESTETSHSMSPRRVCLHERGPQHPRERPVRRPPAKTRMQRGPRPVALGHVPPGPCRCGTSTRSRSGQTMRRISVSNRKKGANSSQARQLHDFRVLPHHQRDRVGERPHPAGGQGPWPLPQRAGRPGMCIHGHDHKTGRASRHRPGHLPPRRRAHNRLAPRLPPPTHPLGKTRRHPRSIPRTRRMRDHSPPRPADWLGTVYATTGDKDGWRGLVSTLESMLRLH